jgi:hypothetical protein
MSVDLQAQLEQAVDEVLDVFQQAVDQDVELDIMGCIVARMRARGEVLDLSELPLPLQMIFGGMGIE